MKAKDLIAIVARRGQVVHPVGRQSGAAEDHSSDEAHGMADEGARAEGATRPVVTEEDPQSPRAEDRDLP